MSRSSEGVGLVVDTSAVVAMLFGEPGSEALMAALVSANDRLMTAATYVELGIVVEARLGPAAADIVPRFVRDAEIDVVAVDADTATRAVGGWRRYGKGRHVAALNFGDGFVYALAERTGYAVLCVGNDFAETDIDVCTADVK